MQPDEPTPRLSKISTLWSLVRQAHHGADEATNAARQQLLERYGGAVRRYLGRLLRDADAVDEVFQEFALQLVHGDLRGADPGRGRFRNFVKGTLFHLIADYRKHQRKWPGALPAGFEVLATDPEPDADRHFTESWCDELLARSWAALAETDARSGQPYYVVLRYRADHPDLPSPEIADRLAPQLGRPLTPAGVRQLLHRAREKFADFLLDEVSNSLDNPTADTLEQELGELGLLEYCRPALGRRDREADA